MKLDRNYIKGDLQEKNIKKIVTYTLSKQVKHIIPIIHIDRHTCKYFFIKKMAFVWPTNVHQFLQNITITPYQICKQAKKCFRNQNYGLSYTICLI